VTGVAEQETIDRSEGGAAAGFSGLSRILGQATASITLVLGLMIYFGWVRTSVLFDVFGISSSTLGLSFQDYALRSVNSTVRPLAAVLLALVVVRPLHRAVLAVARTSPCARILGPRILLLVGLLVMAVGLGGFVGLLDFDVEWPVVPMALGFGVLVAAYAVTLRPAPGPASGPAPAFAALQRVSIAGVVVLTLFWSAATFAQIDGTAAAERIARRPAALPGVVVFAPRRLDLHIIGITETALPPDGEPQYRYRYDGLRLLIRSDGRFFLLPGAWRPGVHAVVLADDPALRVEFFRGP
jgi:hypothetical protein